MTYKIVTKRILEIREIKIGLKTQLDKKEMGKKQKTKNGMYTPIES